VGEISKSCVVNEHLFLVWESKLLFTIPLPKHFLGVLSVQDFGELILFVDATGGELKRPTEAIMKSVQSVA
jgi:hypothetical protein